ncbi:MAG: hypothetical protein ACLFVU_03465 [Phycisphaerae bacterium]
MKFSKSLFCMVLPLLLVACGEVKYTTPIEEARPATAEERSFQRVWKSTIDVLKDKGFEIDRTDPREGVVTTLPMTSKQWFEFWRDENASRKDLLENSLHTIFRSAEVRLYKADEPGQYDLDVQVFVSRSNRQTLMVTSPSEGRELYSSGFQGVRSGRLVGHVGVDAATARQGVVELGRDEGFEEMLRKEIRAEVTSRE